MEEPLCCPAHLGWLPALSPTGCPQSHWLPSLEAHLWAGHCTYSPWVSMMGLALCSQQDRVSCTRGQPEKCHVDRQLWEPRREPPLAQGLRKGFLEERITARLGGQVITTITANVSYVLPVVPGEVLSKHHLAESLQQSFGVGTILVLFY